MSPRFSWFEVERTHRHRPYHSKHVQASCEPETKRFFARRNAASTKPFGNAFAETLQASNRSGMHLQKCCKCQTVREFICRNAASAKPFGNSFAEMLQTPNRSGIHLQERCERSKKWNNTLV